MITWISLRVRVCGMKTVLAAAAALCVVCVVATPQPLRDTFRGWKKRMDQKPSADDFSSDFQQHIPQLSIASSQLMLRSPRGQRQYDVPQIGKWIRHVHRERTNNRVINIFSKYYATSKRFRLTILSLWLVGEEYSQYLSVWSTFCIQKNTCI